jgi:glutamate:GABA antiporter
MQSSKKIGIMALALLITGSIDSIRNMPATALFGPQLVFFAIMGAIFFLIPIGLVAAELVTTKDLKGGIYAWVKKSLGTRMAFMAIWLQWINTIVWYPTILSFIAGTAAYLIDPHLAEHKIYLVAVVLTVYWALTIINLKGIRMAARLASVCTIFGMIIPVALIIILGLVWVFKGLPLQIHFTSHSMLPKLSNTQSWISLTAIVTSFLGMELACVHTKNVKNPKKVFPRSLLFAVFFILGTMILGSLVIAWVLPQSQIHFVDGVMQVFSSFFHQYHLTWILPILAVSLVVGSVGGMINWLISPAKGLLHAAEDHFLPKFFCKLNKNAMPSNLMMIQAVLVTFMCLAFFLMPSVSGSYWLLTDLSTELYVLMYLLMFVAALVLKFKYTSMTSSFTIWGGKFGMTVVCALGLMGCLTTFFIGFFPPATIAVGTKLHYMLTFGIGILVMIAPISLFYWYHQKNKIQDKKLLSGFDVPLTSNIQK